jgi:hypothetical protein
MKGPEVRFPTEKGWGPRNLSPESLSGRLAQLSISAARRPSQFQRKVCPATMQRSEAELLLTQGTNDLTIVRLRRELERV